MPVCLYALLALHPHCSYKVLNYLNHVLSPLSVVIFSRELKFLLFWGEFNIPAQ
jgi:hypothetical protein